MEYKSHRLQFLKVTIAKFYILIQVKENQIQMLKRSKNFNSSGKME